MGCISVAPSQVLHVIFILGWLGLQCRSIYALVIWMFVFNMWSIAASVSLLFLHMILIAKARIIF
jgi:hypothetical protein